MQAKLKSDYEGRTILEIDGVEIAKIRGEWIVRNADRQIKKAGYVRTGAYYPNDRAYALVADIVAVPR